MINGKIKPLWSRRLFSKGPWRITTNHFKGFSTSVAIKKAFKHSIGLSINNSVPQSLEKIAKQHFKLEKMVMALHKMSPGQILPWHKDRYLTYIKNNDIKDKNKIVRIIVFLEDSKPGQQLWIDDKICIGRAGQYFGWKYGTKHMAANLSESNRYVLQITGIEF